MNKSLAYVSIGIDENRIRVLPQWAKPRVITQGQDSKDDSERICVCAWVKQSRTKKSTFKNTFFSQLFHKRFFSVIDTRNGILCIIIHDEIYVLKS